MGFAFSLLGTILKSGYEPNMVTFNTIINGFCMNGMIFKALNFYQDLVAQGYLFDEFTYGILINGL